MIINILGLGLTGEASLIEETQNYSNYEHQLLAKWNRQRLPLI